MLAVLVLLVLTRTLDSFAWTPPGPDRTVFGPVLFLLISTLLETALWSGYVVPFTLDLITKYSPGARINRTRFFDGKPISKISAKYLSI